PGRMPRPLDHVQLAARQADGTHEPALRGPFRHCAYRATVPQLLDQRIETSRPARARRPMKTSRFCGAGISHARSSSRIRQSGKGGSTASWRLASGAGGTVGRSVPRWKSAQKYSALRGHDNVVAFVCGPRRCIVVAPPTRTNPIPGLTEVIELKSVG